MSVGHSSGVDSALAADRMAAQLRPLPRPLPLLLLLLFLVSLPTPVLLQRQSALDSLLGPDFLIRVGLTTSGPSSQLL